MPELPEVETIVRDLRPHLIGRLISGLVIRAACEQHMLQTTPESFYEGVIGQEIQTVLRRGKYILMPLTNGNVIVFHLGMTGRLLLKELPKIFFEDKFKGETYFDKHTHFVMELLDTSDDDVPDLELCFHDVRMFGHIWLVENARNIEELDVPGLRELGPDALSISLSDFEKAISNRRAVKTSLLDQSKLAGVGSIYADEACFLSRVNPAYRGSDLSKEQTARLWFAVKSVLKEGIQYRGSSVSDYTDADGSKGSYQEHHRVYGRQGLPCPDCTAPVERTKVGGRSAHFCPICQPIKAM